MCCARHCDENRRRDKQRSRYRFRAFLSVCVLAGLRLAGVNMRVIVQAYQTASDTAARLASASAEKLAHDAVALGVLEARARDAIEARPEATVSSMFVFTIIVASCMILALYHAARRICFLRLSFSASALSSAVCHDAGGVERARSACGSTGATRRGDAARGGSQGSPEGGTGAAQGCAGVTGSGGAHGTGAR